MYASSFFRSLSTRERPIAFKEREAEKRGREKELVALILMMTSSSGVKRSTL